MRGSSPYVTLLAIGGGGRGRTVTNLGSYDNVAGWRCRSDGMEGDGDAWSLWVVDSGWDGRELGPEEQGDGELVAEAENVGLCNHQPSHRTIRPRH